MIAKMLQRKTAAAAGGGSSVPTPTVYWEADYGIVTTTDGTTADASPVSGNKVLSWTSKDASASVASYSVNSRRPSYFAPSGSKPYVKYTASAGQTLETTAFASTFNNANQYSMGVFFRKIPVFTGYHNQVFLTLNNFDNAGQLIAQGSSNIASIWSGGTTFLGGSRVIVDGSILPTGLGTIFGSFSTTATSSTVAASSNTRLYYNGYLVGSNTTSNATLNDCNTISLIKFPDTTNSVDTEVYGFYLYSTQLSDSQMSFIHSDCLSRFNPITTLPVSGAALWLDGARQSSLFTDAGATNVTTNGQSVYQWNDLSGNSRNALQTTSGNRPTWVAPASGQNGLSATSYDGSNDFFSVSNTENWGLVFSGDFTIDLWAKFTDNTAQQDLLGQDTGGGQQPKWVLGLNNPGAAGAGVLGFLYNLNASQNYTFGVSWTPANNTLYRITVTRSGNDTKFYINGTQQGATNTSANRPRASTGIKLCVGTDGEGYRFTKGQFNEVLFFPFAYSASNMTAMSAYSLSKWGVS